jgi:hypothetical protein
MLDLKAQFSALLSIFSTTSSYLLFATDLCQFIAALLGIIAAIVAIKLSMIKLKNEVNINSKLKSKFKK